jgi:hypothetical protein
LKISACVGYGWIVAASVPRPAPAFIASVISEIISPACRATSVAPTIVSLPFRVCTLRKPSVSPSRMARSLFACSIV